MEVDETFFGFPTERSRKLYVGNRLALLNRYVGTAYRVRKTLLT